MSRFKAIDEFQVDAARRQPLRVQVALDEIGIGQIDRWWADHAVNHFLRLAKEILVVRALGGAVGDDKRGLPLRPARPLRCA